MLRGQLMKILIALLIATPLLSAQWGEEELYYYERFRLSTTTTECWIFVFDRSIITMQRDYRQFPGLLDSVATWGIYDVIGRDDQGVVSKERHLFRPYENFHKGKRDVNQHSFSFSSETWDGTTHLSAPDFTDAGILSVLQWVTTERLAELQTRITTHEAELALKRARRAQQRQLPTR